VTDADLIDEVAARLRPHYRRFLDPAEGQILLTGHSHQAWPEASRLGQIAAWDEAAQLCDEKWHRVLGEVLDEFRRHVAKRIGTLRHKDLAVAPNTHELVHRLATCFDPRGSVVTTDSEFHSLRRQLIRSAEEGLRVTRVPADAPDFADRFLSAIDDARPDWIALSSVLFTTSRVLPIDPILERCAERDIPVLIDAYHAFNAIELEVDRWPGSVFVCGGGYKYAQIGEGACWLLVPRDAERYRPVYTGWFADFENLDSIAETVSYGPGGMRFFGATFDPTALYRGVYVLRFMDEMGMTVTALREVSLAATSLIIDAYDSLALASTGLVLATPREPARRGAFVAFRRDDAKLVCARLAERGVRADVRGPLLRVGPAPYLTSAEIMGAMEILAEVARTP
jgi:selenocysteine lyase/cysteine desulfurase